MPMSTWSKKVKLGQPPGLVVSLLRHCSVILKRKVVPPIVTYKLGDTIRDIILTTKM